MTVEGTLLAARQGEIDTLKVQLEEKVLNSDVKDSLGATPVHHAARAGKLSASSSWWKKRAYRRTAWLITARAPLMTQPPPATWSACSGSCLREAVKLR